MGKGLFLNCLFSNLFRKINIFMLLLLIGKPGGRQYEKNKVLIFKKRKISLFPIYIYIILVCFCISQ